MVLPLLFVIDQLASYLHLVLDLVFEYAANVIIFDELSIVIRIINANNGDSTDMSCQKNGHNLLSVVTPSVRRPITLDCFLCCRRC